MIKKLNELFSNIYFIEHNHTYVNTDTGDILTSVTTKKKEYIQPFKNKEYWLNRKAMEAGMSPDEMQEEWDEKRIVGTSRGSIIHDFAENLSNRKITSPELNYTGLAKLKRQVNAYFRDYSKYTNLATEFVVGNKEIGGMIDRLCFNEKGELGIVDYKGLALDTLIPTPSGFKLLKDIKVGDKVFDGNGEITNVKHVSDIHYNPCFKIKFETNEEVIADHEHKWVILEGRADRKKKKTVTTEYLYNYVKKNGSSKKLRIENHKGIQSESDSVPLDPYILGLWLGDGNSYDAKLSCTNSVIWEKICSRGFSVSKNLEKRKEGCEVRTIYNIRKHLVELNVLKNKHIPLLYLRSSRKNRLLLLQGLMDSDGYFNKSRNRYVMVTTKLWQAQGLKELVSTLGYNCTIIPAKTSGFGKENIPCFHVTFSCDINPFMCRNRNPAMTTNMQQVRSRTKYIKSVEKVKTVPTKCISVESEDSTYLFGRGMIKTHNTDKAFKEAYGKKMSGPYSHLPSDSLHGYYLQVNMYRQLLEEKGIKIHFMDIVHFGINNDNYLIFNVPKIDIIW